jgi:Icc-related predicted phosphoesterase
MLDASLEGLPKDVHYLSDSGITIDGISFYGAPMFVVFGGEELKEVEHYEQIPDNTDILITLRPPLGILDSIDDHLHYGSSILLDKISNIKPKMHLFGHVHSAYGTMDWKGVTFSNAGLTDWKYDVCYSPQLLEIN